MIKVVKWHRKKPLTWAQFFILIALMLLAQVFARGTEVAAHRCGAGIAPENTLAAAHRCIELGVPWVEIDVRSSKDGVFYLMHDRTVDRTTDGTGALDELTSDYIYSLDAGSWFDPRYTGEKVPRLRDFLRDARGKLKVYLDYKGGDITELVRLIQEMDMARDMLFFFTLPQDIQQFRRLAPDWPLKVTLEPRDNVPDLVDRWRPAVIECLRHQMTDAFIEACKTLQVKTMLYDLRRDEKTFKFIAEHQPDYVVTDYPDLLLRYLREQHFQTH